MTPAPNFIPKHKHDIDATNELSKMPWEAIRPHVAALLEWLQDINWPVAGPVAEVLCLHTNKIKGEIISILRSNDGVWKYWCIIALILHSKETFIDEELLAEIKRIVEQPTEDDIKEEVVDAAKEALGSWQ